MSDLPPGLPGNETKTVKPSAPLKLARFAEADGVRRAWAVTPETGVTQEDILRPEFWAHVWEKLRPLDRIEVRAEDGSFWAELLVVDRRRAWVRVKMIHYVPIGTLAPTDVIDMDELSIRYMGPHWKWAVVRKKDSEMVIKGFSDKLAAHQAAAEYQKAVA